MTKRLPLFLGAAAIGLTIAAWDRSRATETTLRATVIEVEERQMNAGPDQWFLTVTFEDQTHSLGPLQARPTVAAGDIICVIQSVAGHRDTTYRRAPASTVC
ncbi:hypothetical protein [uncultured Sulfitobacter sp.]|uniref:hypothetical protein n=1 Tax=uncultured Sulfitobacter sp. TaxID=191468 RepID=UPI002605C7E5|nr:hypothetical protein [uncultured Sulfitobacter sp.]